MEDLQRPDADELDDSLINEEVREITEFAEDPPPQRGDLYCSTPPLHRRERHLYRFFIDGSLRTYYLATGIERNTYGLITNIEHRTDAPSHLSNFISNNFGDLTEEPNTPRQLIWDHNKVKRC